MRKMVLTVAAFAFASAVFAETVPATEYSARRARVAQAIGANSILILTSPEAAVRNNDVDYPFRQDDNLYYLTGIADPQTTLVLAPGATDYKEVLFVRERDPLQERWTGRIPTFDEVRTRSGVATVTSNEFLNRFIGAIVMGQPWAPSRTNPRYVTGVDPEFADAVQHGTAQTFLALGSHRGAVMQYAKDLRDRYPEVAIRDATTVMRDIREVKTPVEIGLLRRATDISAQAQIAGMRRALTATNERQVQATIEYTFRELGACCWGYPSIVASGANATTLHYNSDEAPIERGVLLLADVGADYAGYTADVTRTYPVNGKFTADQRAIYDAVYRASQTVIAMARPGRKWLELHEAAEKSLGEDLLRLGLITKNDREQVGLYFFHGIGHPIGLQVHDVFRAVRPLEPGMVLAIEPGIYVRRDDVVESKLYRAMSDADKKRVDTALARYNGIGVRLEDNVLITNGEPELLTSGAPRSGDDIEKVMAQKK